MKIIRLLLFASVVPACFAQYGAGIILGTVKDASNAVVPGVTVTARNNQTGESRTFTTDAAGDFRFNAVPPGNYTVTASSPAFKTAVISNLVVTVNTETRADFTLEVGQVADRVNVEATAPLLQTDTAALAGC